MTMTIECPQVEMPQAIIAANQKSAPFYPAPNSNKFANALRQLGIMLEWNFRGLGQSLPLVIIIQILMAVLTIFGYSMLLGDAITPEAATFLTTGSVTVQLIVVGLVMTPQSVAQAKTEGSLTWMRTLPMPQLVFFFADLLLYTAMAIPGTVLSLALASWRFGITLSISPWLVPAVLLVALISATVGYAIALLLDPKVAMLITQVLVFVVLMFSPINMPPANLPNWLAGVHNWLPIAPMAELIRATLVSDTFTMPLHSTIVLAFWTLIALASAGRALSRRA